MNNGASSAIWHDSCALLNAIEKQSSQVQPVAVLVTVGDC
jgi:hypothetical protein